VSGSHGLDDKEGVAHKIGFSGCRKHFLILIRKKKQRENIIKN